MADVLIESNMCPIAKPTTTCYWKKIWRGLNVMRQNFQFCDVVLTSSDNKYFMAHTAMLVASSPIFLNYFSSSEVKNRIDVNSKINLYFPEVPSDVLHVVLDFIYGITPTTPMELLRLCAGSKYFGIEEAYAYCMKYLTNNDKLKKPIYSHAFDVLSLPSDNTNVIRISNEVKDLETTSEITLPDPKTSPTSANIHSSDAKDLECDGITGLSFTELTLGNECPHMRRLIDQHGIKDAPHGLDFQTNVESERSESRESNCLSEFDGFIGEASIGCPSFLDEENFSDRVDGNVDLTTIQDQDDVGGNARSDCVDPLQFIKMESNSGDFTRHSRVNGTLIVDEIPTTDDLFELPGSTGGHYGDENIFFDKVGTSVAGNPSYVEMLSMDNKPLGSMEINKESTSSSFDETTESLVHLIYEGIGYRTENGSTGVYQGHENGTSGIYRVPEDTPRVVTSPNLKIRKTSSASDGIDSQNKLWSQNKMLRFMCHDCGEIFTTNYKLQTHQLKQHNKGKLFSCLHCTFKSPRKKDLQAHSLSQHGEKPPGVKIYACTSCQYKCIDKNRFEEHEAIHKGVLKYECPLCNKAYTTRRGMKTHLKYHSESRPFKCTLCPSDFKVKSKLTDHMKLIHLQKGVKPYKCGYCNHFTALRGNCNQHVKKNHPGQPVLVIDTMSSARKHVKNYDYANLHGSDIDEHHEICSTQYVKQYS